MTSREAFRANTSPSHTTHKHVRRRQTQTQSNDNTHRHRPLSKPSSDLRRFVFVLLMSSIICPVASAVPLAGVSVPTSLSKADKDELLLFDRRPSPTSIPREAKRHVVDMQTVTTVIAAPGHSAYSAHKAEATALLTDSGQQLTPSLPTPFDTGVGNNFTTTTCPAFFRSFLSNSDFTTCYPLSLLLQVSPHNCTLE